jgi:uncharacterized membrane protein YbaN (DUF454 family)
MKRVKQITYSLTGFILVLVGVVGLILPILPGWALIFVGLILISLEVPSLDEFVSKMASKNLKFEVYYRKFRKFIREKLGYEI